jgi:hypothetical protein
MGTICENELEKGKEHKWRIKILKTFDYSIMVGVASSDFDINLSTYNTCGWYFYLYNLCLYSGPSHNYNGKKTNLSKIKDINIIKKNMQKFNNIDKIYVEFRPESDDDNIPIFKAIKNFGEIYSNLDIKYKFKPCPKNISEDRKYIVSGQNGNILTKKGHDMNGMGTICDIIFRKDGIYSWKIKILKTFDYNISIGVAPSDFNIHSSYSTYGWYFYLRDSSLRSGPPHNYEFHKTNLKKARNEIIVIMNMKKRTLKFIVDNEDKGDSFTDIPIDKLLSPTVLLYNNDDSIEISKFN